MWVSVRHPPWIRWVCALAPWLVNKSMAADHWTDGPRCEFAKCDSKKFSRQSRRQSINYASNTKPFCALEVNAAIAAIAVDTKEATPLPLLLAHVTCSRCIRCNILSPLSHNCIDFINLSRLCVCVRSFFSLPFAGRCATSHSSNYFYFAFLSPSPNWCGASEWQSVCETVKCADLNAAREIRENTPNRPDGCRRTDRFARKIYRMMFDLSR